MTSRIIAMQHRLLSGYLYAHHTRDLLDHEIGERLDLGWQQPAMWIDHGERRWLGWKRRKHGAKAPIPEMLRDLKRRLEDDPLPEQPQFGEHVPIVRVH